MLEKVGVNLKSMRPFHPVHLALSSPDPEGISGYCTMYASVCLEEEIVYSLVD